MESKRNKIIVVVSVILVAIIACVLIAIFTKPEEEKPNDETIKEDNNIYDIKFSKSYNKTSKTYTLVFSNVVSDLYITDGENKYVGNNKNEVTIYDIEEGEEIVYAIDKEVPTKNSRRTMKITFPYFNPYYNTDICKGYDGKVSVCSNQFLSYKVTEDLVKNSIKNYNTDYSN